MSLSHLVLFALGVISCRGFLFSHDSHWNNLRVTFGLNPLSSVNYAAMPLTEQDAKHKGFQKISDCGDNAALPGRRYIKDNDMAVILIYDVQGYIAGISAAVQEANGYPSSFLKNHPFVLSGGKHHISAYFVPPASICSSGRTAAQVGQQGIGTDLYIQNGTDPVAHSIKIPHKETEVQWTRGKCFPAMGDHYWFNVRKDMSCDEFYPVFLLYNGGQLNAFGWAFQADFTSQRIEHPPKNVISALVMICEMICEYSNGDKYQSYSNANTYTVNIKGHPDFTNTTSGCFVNTTPSSDFFLHSYLLQVRRYQGVVNNCNFGIRRQCHDKHTR